MCMVQLIDEGKVLLFVDVQFVHQLPTFKVHKFRYSFKR
jgi:hypothetical protein